MTPSDEIHNTNTKPHGNHYIELMFGRTTKINRPRKQTEKKRRGRGYTAPPPLSACLSVSVVCPRRTPCQSERTDGETAGADKATGDETIRPVCFRLARRLLVEPQEYIPEDADRERHTDGMGNGRNRIVDDEEHIGNLSACFFPFGNIHITENRQGTGREQCNPYSQHDCIGCVMIPIYIYKAASIT